MRTYISPIGYNTTSVTRPVLLSRGLETDDTVVLLRPDTEADDRRAQGAIAEVERMLEEIEPEVSTAVEHVDHEDFPAAVLTCSDVIRAASGTIIVNLSGGARDVLLPLTVASLAHVKSIDTVLTFSDIDGNVREWELPVLTTDVPAAALETLAYIDDCNGSVSIPELTERSDHAKSTVTRHVNQLEECGVVTTWQEGKTKYARVSLSGRLRLRAGSGDRTRNG